VTGIRERRRKHLPDDLKGKIGYCKLKDEAPERSHSIKNSLWKRLWTCRKTDSKMNEWIYHIKYIKCVCRPAFNYSKFDPVTYSCKHVRNTGLRTKRAE